MSYHHVEWLPISNVESAHLGKHRVKKFLSKYHAEGEKGDDYQEYLKVCHRATLVSGIVPSLTIHPITD
jgi:hypothetical protein